MHFAPWCHQFCCHLPRHGKFGVLCHQKAVIAIAAYTSCGQHTVGKWPRATFEPFVDWVCWVYWVVVGRIWVFGILRTGNISGYKVTQDPLKSNHVKIIQNTPVDWTARINQTILLHIAASCSLTEQSLQSAWQHTSRPFMLETARPAPHKQHFLRWAGCLKML